MEIEENDHDSISIKSYKSLYKDEENYYESNLITYEKKLNYSSSFDESSKEESIGDMPSQI